MKNDIQSVAKKLVKAYNNNKLINPIPDKFCKNIKLAHKLRLLCESKIKDTKVGFKAGGTIIALLKKLKEKEPFHSTVFGKNLIKSGGRVKINKYALGTEVEVYYIIKKIFLSKYNSDIDLNNINQRIRDAFYNKETSRYLNDLFETYYEFPPLINNNHNNEMCKKPILQETPKNILEFSNELLDYNFITYIKLK